MSGKTKEVDTHSLFIVSSRDYFMEVVEASFVKRNIKTYPAIQSYMVGLLEHYLDARNLFDEPMDEAGNRKPTTLAEMYLTAATAEHAAKIDLLKKMADRSLYISGFFGDSLTRKLVDIDYYAEMGGAAYGNLAECTKEDTVAQIYRTFSSRFIEFVDVLTYISQQSSVQTDQGLLRLYDRYMRTGSELAKEKLIELGVLTLPKDQAKLARQD
ncbi:MAG: hypothetical protein COT73_08630 [Bdellovibrio sp. CG10_big_fil_rev_8_21_14_0_10_47_8]|nr:MAG: hypothetical protein COT73_08630 [Bdellovibrio sp. CG10_big_fil_rev_8_21_14_0_10_47_8]